MANDPRVEQLLDEILDSERTPEEVCVAFPDLLPEVRRRWRQVCAVQAGLEALFPTPAPDPSPETAAPSSLGTDLPRIPGYEIEAVLGRGGMGIVYKARDLRLNRPVALKMLLSGMYAAPQEQERFLREAEAVASLRHGNIIQVYGAGDHDRRPYFTMEYVEGGSLAQRLSGAPQPARQAAALLTTLAEAVQAAHQGGIVHRDLKPANILLTANGTPKIGDFGLARRLDSEDGLTRTGTALGTPSYMAPEQALGKTRAIGPPVDIYALGTILYEMLTGRPPFRAETAAETERQVIAEEPAPPSRLNAKVPRDLETICLKCLNKESHRRYPTAAALADDLQRYDRGEPISARRPGRLERLSKWARRRPAGAALLGTTCLFTTIILAVMLSSAVQQAKRRDALEADLREISQFQQQARWTDARVALQRAEARLIGGGAADLRQRLSQTQGDLDLVFELDRIQLNRATNAGDLAYYKAKADQQYQTAFDKSGLAAVHERSDVVAARVKASSVRLALIAALDDWAVCATDKSRRDWLLLIAREAEPDPLGWGDRIRDPARWDNRAALSELAETVPVKGQSVSLLLTLGERLRAANVVPIEFFKRVQKEHPADFWANIALGDAVLWAAPVEAAGYYRAALASRPKEAVAYTALGDSLRVQKRYDEARGYYRQALEIDPYYARGQTSLGNLLKDSGQLDEAIACYRKALQLDPNYTWAHLDLANALRDADRLEEALQHYRQVHAFNQTIPYVENILRSDLVRRGRGEEVRREWKKELERDPPQHVRWFGYAELCLFLGDDKEYRRACQDLLRRFGNTSDPYIAEPTARAVLLAPPSEEELRTALALADRAVTAEPTKYGWVYPYFLFAKGLAEYRRGNFEGAISILTGPAAKVLGPCPGLVTAMAKYRLGDQQGARTVLAAEISAFDWSMARVRGHDQWLWHVLRREAEALIFPNTAAFLQGKYEPCDNTERLALLGACWSKNRTCAAARLYAEAFAADPTLADDPRFRHRYNAARAAALAGCGQGDDVADLGATEKKRWRNQAREWLQADLASLVRAYDANPTAARARVRKALSSWLDDPGLRCVRTTSELDKLPLDERKKYVALWAEVTAVRARDEN
jgi:serine/threonine protein kinase/tetratricopeptide (TPR) repeat protein